MKFNIKLLIVAIITCSCVYVVACSSSVVLKKYNKNLTQYTINAVYNDDTKSLYAEETVIYQNLTGQILNELNFHLYPNAFRADAKNKTVSKLNEEKAYPNGFSEGNITIKNLSVGGEKTNFVIGGEDQNILIIPLIKRLDKNDKIKIVFNFDLKIPNCLHRFGYSDNSINLGNWYPIICKFENKKFRTDLYDSNGDPFYSDMANYKISLSLDKEFTVASTGVQTIEKVDSSTNKYVIKAEVVRDFALVLSKEFKQLHKNINNTQIKYYYYSDTKAEQSLQTSVDALKTFNKLYGEYPYTQLSVVETGFVHGGMEYPNLVYISDNIEKYEDYQNVIIHEIAHQWWYALVGNNQVEDAWIDEGLAELSCLLFFENNPSYNVKKEEKLGTTLQSYLLFIDVYKDILKDVDTTMTRSLSEYPTEPEYTYMAYVKSLLMFDSLREIIGEDSFKKGLKYLFKENVTKIIDEKNVISAFEKYTNYNLKDFFASWLNGKIVIEQA